MVEYAVRVKQLCKYFGPFAANDAVDFQVRRGSIHGLVGENGAGKSTLLKILFGIEVPTSGEIWINERRKEWASPRDAIRSGLGMVQQHFALVDSLSALDNIILGAEPTAAWGRLNRARALARIQAQLPSPTLAVKWDEPVGQMSVGDRQRIEILKLLYRDVDILFLDEPTAVLTPAETADLLDVLKGLRARGKTIIFVSHKFSEILAVCDEVTVLRRGRSIWTRPITSRAGVQLTAEELVTAMLGQPPSAAVPVPAFAGTAADVVLAFARVSDLERGRDTLENLSFELRAGEILGVAGVSGSGQKSIIEVAMGLRKFRGEARVLGVLVKGQSPFRLRRLGIGLIPEERLGEGLWESASLSDNLIVGLEDRFEKPWLKALGIFDPPKIAAAAELTKKFDVRYQNLGQAAGSLSGGNQQKLIFTREVEERKPKLLLCFHPGRGVDLGALKLIHRELRNLRQRGVAILYISHELDELMELGDRILVMCDGKRTGLFEAASVTRETIGHAMSGVSS